VCFTTFTDCFSGPATAVDQVCVCVCVCLCANNNFKLEKRPLEVAPIMHSEAGVTYLHLIFTHVTRTKLSFLLSLSLLAEKRNIFSCDLEHWPVTLSCECHLDRIKVNPAKICRSKVISFESCRPNTHTNTHTERLLYTATMCPVKTTNNYN